MQIQCGNLFLGENFKTSVSDLVHEWLVLIWTVCVEQHQESLSRYGNNYSGKSLVLFINLSDHVRLLCSCIILLNCEANIYAQVHE